MHPSFEDYLLKVTKATSCEETQIIQSLWSGYGKISRYRLINSELDTVVVKNINLTSSQSHPRGWNSDFGHQRKIKSYEVESCWYQTWSHLCTDSCRIPRHIASLTSGQNQWIILEDLDSQFPGRKQGLRISEVKVGLKWLANFHSTFLNQEPKGLWDIGTYWNLKTRPEEFKKMQHTELRSKASQIDDILNNCKYKTIVHGDAKVANFCFSKNGNEVAAVDFQYVGGGCGVKDVVYFLGSCLSSSECQRFEEELLNYYFSKLEICCSPKLTRNEISELIKEWRYLYPIACTDFTRFLLGWMPSHQKVNDYHLDIMNAVLAHI